MWIISRDKGDQLQMVLRDQTSPAEKGVRGEFVH